MKTQDSEEHEDKDEKHSHIEEVRQRINQGLYLFLYAYRTEECETYLEGS